MSTIRGTKVILTKQWIGKLALVVASVALTLLLVEGSARLFVAMTDAKEPAPSEVGLQWHEHREFGLVPLDYRSSDLNVSGGVRATTDQPVDAACHLYVFGGSTVFGSLMAPDSNTIPSNLQRMLSAAGVKIRVVNMGASTVTSRQSIARLKTLSLRPCDSVVLYDGVNDVIQYLYYNNPHNTMAEQLRWQYEQLNWPARTLLYLHLRMSRFSVFFRRFVNPIKRVPPPGTLNRYDESLLKQFHSLYLHQIREANAYAIMHGAKFFHFLQPSAFSTPLLTAAESRSIEQHPNYPPNLRNAYVVSYPVLRAAVESAHREGMDSRDLSELFAGRDPGQQLFTDFCHLTPAGDSAVARAIADVIVPRLSNPEAEPRRRSRHRQPQPDREVGGARRRAGRPAGSTKARLRRDAPNAWRACAAYRAGPATRKARLTFRVPAGQVMASPTRGGARPSFSP